MLSISGFFLAMKIRFGHYRAVFATRSTLSIDLFLTFRRSNSQFSLYVYRDKPSSNSRSPPILFFIALSSNSSIKLCIYFIKKCHHPSFGRGWVGCGTSGIQGWLHQAIFVFLTPTQKKLVFGALNFKLSVYVRHKSFIRPHKDVTGPSLATS